MLAKSSHLSLQLLETTIYAEQQADTCSVIRGTVYANLPKSTTIQRISVQFSGKMEAKSHSLNYHKPKTVANQQLILYQATSNSPLLLTAGTTPFGFEMQVASGLPESIECSDVKVSYQVTATMEYTTTHPVLRRPTKSKEETRQDIRVTRLPQQGILTGDTNNFIDSRTHQSNWLCYQLLVDKKAVALGSVLPITFRLLPMTEALSIDRITVQMLERRHLYRDTTHTTYSVCTMPPCCNVKQDVIPTQLSENWEGTVYYRVPCGKTMVHSTRPYSEFHVDHCVLVSIGFSVPSLSNSRFGNTRVHKLITFKANIDVLDKVVGDLDSLELPSYDSPPPFEDHGQVVYGEYDRKFVEPPAYEDI
ncbi:hypothetical protein BD560DRAFT_486955 [Blakeslea trispora]|nr:hypothetical protein BD560DRAFT_486955 [Blakeslea trispora]